MNTEFYGSYIYHHGIRGQKWGRKNGPPYPLSQEDYSKAEKNQKKSNKLAEKKGVTKYGHEEHTIPKGTMIYRTTATENDLGDGEKYYSYLDFDRDHYNGGWIRQTGKTGKAYEHKYMLKDDIKIPSRDVQKKAIADILKEDKNSKIKIVNSYLNAAIPEGSWLREEYSIDKNTGNASKKAWQDFVKQEIERFGNMSQDEAFYYASRSLGTAPDIRKKVVEKIKSQGYNAMVDVASVGGDRYTDSSGKTRYYKKEGVEPIIVFDSSSFVSQGTREITKEEEEKASYRDSKRQSRFNRG